jgi:hypothetical protein
MLWYFQLPKALAAGIDRDVADAVLLGHFRDRRLVGSRRILTICSSENRVFFMAPSFPSGPSSQSLRWYGVRPAGQVWQNATCTAFYRKNMIEEVTSLSPEPVTGFILSRKWFRLGDYRLLK